MNEFTIIFVIALILSLDVQWWLKLRHLRHVQHHQHVVPEAFSEKISLSEHQKAAEYTLTKTKFGLISLVVEAIILLIWTLGGLLDFLDQSWQSVGWSPLWTGVAVMVSMTFIASILDLPMSLYDTFRIESKFGFNRMTLGLFFKDLLKSWLITLLVLPPLITLILWLMAHAGAYWWLSVWAVWISFSLLMLWAYPAFIAPLFNKFTPLENNELKQRIESLLQRNGFASQGIFVMDGSTRSGHGNAYFTGLGNQKRIVFFDTLLEGLTHEEIEAVLAHEIGHFKHKHIQKRIVTMAILSLASLALLGWLMQQTWFYSGLGVSTPSTHTALILFMLIMPVFTFFLNPIMAWASRRHEFQADEFAAQQAKPETLIQALVKLYRENASTLTPDPLHSAFYDSHPPASMRIAHLTKQ
jgi:STE24 endopeptidase